LRRVGQGRLLVAAQLDGAVLVAVFQGQVEVVAAVDAGLLVLPGQVDVGLGQLEGRRGGQGGLSALGGRRRLALGLGLGGRRLGGGLGAGRVLGVEVDLLGDLALAAAAGGRAGALQADVAVGGRLGGGVLADGGLLVGARLDLDVAVAGVLQRDDAGAAVGARARAGARAARGRGRRLRLGVELDGEVHVAGVRDEADVAVAGPRRGARRLAAGPRRGRVAGGARRRGALGRARRGRL